jgi:5-methylcytosine-specific restriction endonuclease McrA
MTELPMFPRPSDIKDEPVLERVYKDGRTKINQLTKAGRELYQQRKRIAWEKQGKICPICKKRLTWADATTDHIRPRSLGFDDREENIQAVHYLCNIRKGSQQNYVEDLAP